MVQNTTPYTYFGRRPIELAEDVTLDDGTLAGVVLAARQPDRHADRHLPRPRRTTPASSSTAASPPSPARPRGDDQIARRARAAAQVDGNYLGFVPEARFWADHPALASSTERR